MPETMERVDKRTPETLVELTFDFAERPKGFGRVRAGKGGTSH